MSAPQIRRIIWAMPTTSPTRRTAITAALAAALLAGCTAQAPDAIPEPSTLTTAPTSSPEASHSGEAASSVEQWASRIAPLKADWQEQQDGWDEATCSSLAAAEAVDCQVHLLTMGSTASSIAIMLEALTNPDAPVYLGDPHAEIADLYSQTAAAADAASAAGEAVECPGEDCVSTGFEFTRAWDKLGDALEGWAPYL